MAHAEQGMGLYLKDTAHPKWTVSQNFNNLHVLAIYDVLIANLNLTLAGKVFHEGLIDAVLAFALGQIHHDGLELLPFLG